MVMELEPRARKTNYSVSCASQEVHLPGANCKHTLPFPAKPAQCVMNQICFQLPLIITHYHVLKFVQISYFFHYMQFCLSFQFIYFPFNPNCS